GRIHQWRDRDRSNAAPVRPHPFVRKGVVLMNLRQRLGQRPGNAPPPPPGLLASRAPEAAPDRYQVIKKQLHRELVGKLDLAQLEGLDENERRTQVERVARRMLVESEIRLTRPD